MSTTTSASRPPSKPARRKCIESDTAATMQGEVEIFHDLGPGPALAAGAEGDAAAHEDAELRSQALSGPIIGNLKGYERSRVAAQHLAVVGDGSSPTPSPKCVGGEARAFLVALPQG